MDREGFMSIVYDELYSDGDNNRANRIIDAADEYAESAQLGTNLAEVGTRAVRGYTIDADALMEKVAEEYGERARDRLYQIIRYMPPVTPKQRTGKWIIRRWGGDAMCSECRMHFRDVYDMDNSDNFCRHCGTPMDGIKMEGDAE